MIHDTPQTISEALENLELDLASLKAMYAENNDLKAIEKVINVNYRKLQLKYHPDKNIKLNDDEKLIAEKMSKRINSANTFLSENKEIFEKSLSSARPAQYSDYQYQGSRSTQNTGSDSKDLLDEAIRKLAGLEKLYHSSHSFLEKIRAELNAYSVDKIEETLGKLRDEINNINLFSATFTSLNKKIANYMHLPQFQALKSNLNALSFIDLIENANDLIKILNTLKKKKSEPETKNEEAPKSAAANLLNENIKTLETLLRDAEIIDVNISADVINKIEHSATQMSLKLEALKSTNCNQDQLNDFTRKVALLLEQKDDVIILLINMEGFDFNENMLRELNISLTEFIASMKQIKSSPLAEDKKISEQEKLMSEHTDYLNKLIEDLQDRAEQLSKHRLKDKVSYLIQSLSETAEFIETLLIENKKINKLQKEVDAKPIYINEYNNNLNKINERNSLNDEQKRTAKIKLHASNIQVMDMLIEDANEIHTRIETLKSKSEHQDAQKQKSFDLIVKRIEFLIHDLKGIKDLFMNLYNSADANDVPKPFVRPMRTVRFFEPELSNASAPEPQCPFEKIAEDQDVESNVGSFS